MLTAKQAAFVASYVLTGNATQSAITAGYSEKTAGAMGFENLQKPEIVEALAVVHGTALQRVQASEEEAVGSAEWIIREAAETYEEAREGKQYGPAITALALLAKRHSEFRETAPAPNQTLVLSGLSSEQLDAAIAKLAGGRA